MPRTGNKSVKSTVPTGSYWLYWSISSSCRTIYWNAYHTPRFTPLSSLSRMVYIKISVKMRKRVNEKYQPYICIYLFPFHMHMHI